jgi:hypothetical protein
VLAPAYEQFAAPAGDAAAGGGADPGAPAGDGQ